ncbi:hypothetical protein QUA82_26740 [Microcoleus sp. F8-D3]|uniref:Pepco domain-containing protein n=1 Tax=Phormidium nigroviride PCC 7112 TaxID=179408 RepID=K9VTP7_9CYAN|nr:hypothetical protein [Oscillatoria nigro-viridis]AFZ10575.1 hypothetical protein Osc7112_6425 [Oscillatoria nigro-viridis PCC 7112]
MSDDSSQIWIVTEVETTESVEILQGQRSSDDTGGGFGQRVKEQIKTTVQQRVPLDAAALKVQMNGLLKVLGDISTEANQQNGLQLDEVELSVEINGEGQVSILGNSGKLGNKGAIKLKFKRTTTNS